MIKYRDALLLFLCLISVETLGERTHNSRNENGENAKDGRQFIPEQNNGEGKASAQDRTESTHSSASSHALDTLLGEILKDPGLRELLLSGLEEGGAGGTRQRRKAEEDEDGQPGNVQDLAEDTEAQDQGVEGGPDFDGAKEVLADPKLKQGGVCVPSVLNDMATSYRNMLSATKQFIKSANRTLMERLIEECACTTQPTANCESLEVQAKGRVQLRLKDVLLDRLQDYEQGEEGAEEEEAELRMTTAKRRRSKNVRKGGGRMKQGVTMETLNDDAVAKLLQVFPLVGKAPPDRSSELVSSPPPESE